MEKLKRGSAMYIITDDDLSSVYRKRNRYEKGTAKKILNVREGPGFDTDVLCDVRAGEEFEIDHEESTRNFYKIYTSSGVEGYILKEFVKTGG